MTNMASLAVGVTKDYVSAKSEPLARSVSGSRMGLGRGMRGAQYHSSGVRAGEPPPT